MTISTKGKRKIIVNQRLYLWWVFNEIDQTEFDGLQVKVVAEDQSIYLKYGLQQKPNNQYLVVSFNHNLGKVHILCPSFENDTGIITPSGVSELINWASTYPNENNIINITHAWSCKYGILDKIQTNQVYKQLVSNLQQAC